MATYGGWTDITAAALGGSDTAAEVLPSEYYAKKFVDRLKSMIQTLPLATREDIPMRSGQVCRWPLFDRLAVITTAHAEGDDPAPVAINITNYDATLLKYGNLIEVSEEVDLQTVNGTMDELADMLTVNGQESIEALILSTLDGTTTTVDGGVAGTASGLNQCARTLANSRVRVHRLNRFYNAIVSAECAYDIADEGAPTWGEAKARAFNDALVTPFQSDTPGLAVVHNVCVKISNEVQAAASEDLNVVLGDNSFGVSSLDSNLSSPSIMAVPTGQPDRGSPTGAWGTLAWRIYFAVVNFSSTRIVKYTTDQT